MLLLNQEAERGGEFSAYFNERDVLMKKKLFAYLCALCMCGSVMSACGDSSSSSTADTPSSSEADSSLTDSSTPDASAPDSSAPDSSTPDEPVTPIDVTQGATDEMLERAYIYNGDLSRLAAVISRAQADVSNITNICYFGDSISAGSGAKNSNKAYATLFYKWWSDNISVGVQQFNESIGATDSYLAVHRFQGDVAELDCMDWVDGIQSPDIIIIEYINDANTEFYKETMESLVRKALALPGDPAVIILEPTCQDGSSPQTQHLEIAKKYNIPFISYHDAVMPEIEKGAFAWEDISNDTVHPNDAGHAMIAQMLEGLVNYTIENMDTIGTEVTPFDPASESLTGDKYANAERSDRKRPLDKVVCTDEGTFTKNSGKQWPYINDYATYNGGSTTWEIEAKNIGIAYYRTTNGLTGKATVTVDGVEVATLDGDFPGGWGNYAAICSVYEGEEVAKHTVTVSLPEGEADDFYILSWLIS